MAVADLYAVEMLLAAFAGGVFGAAIGALPSFAFTGFLVIAGELYNVVQRHLALAGDGTAIADVAITSNVAFGPVLGPHITFGGGAFGVFGYWVATVSTTFGLPWDPVAMGVVLSALAHRAAFGYDLVGASLGRLLDMSPYERRSGVAADGGRPAVEPWMSYAYEWPSVSMLGLAVGVLGAYVAYYTASPFLAFGISAASVLFVVAGVERIPITHHITLPASTVVLAVVPGKLATLTPAVVAAALPLWQALVLGAGAGLVGALAGELCQRVFFAHADTHLDPPAASIVVTSFLVGVLALVGVLPGSVWVPLP
jgi:hypothetical protein